LSEVCRTGGKADDIFDGLAGQVTTASPDDWALKRTPKRGYNASRLAEAEFDPTIGWVLERGPLAPDMDDFLRHCSSLVHVFPGQFHSSPSACTLSKPSEGF
jgi:hypothetical protein